LSFDPGFWTNYFIKERMMFMQQQNRRRQYMINKPFQHKIIIYLALLVVSTILIAHGFAIGYAKLMEITKAPEQISRAAGSGLQAAGSWDALWLPILITILLGIIFVLIFGLLYSHRIAGPLFNLKRLMLRVGGGDLSTVMHIRSGDEFHDVQDTFNQMILGLNQKMEAVKDGLRFLPDKDKRKLERLLNEHFVTRAPDQSDIL
jgi:methyl-accepting chemotaxis protein